MHQMSGFTSTTDSSSVNEGALLFFVSAAFLIAWQGLHSLSLALLKLIWSDEGKSILGSSVFYPTIAMSVLFIVARMVPVTAVKKCACFCKRKGLAVWKRIRMAIAIYQSMIAKMAAKRSQVWASFRVVIGAFEILCL